MPSCAFRIRSGWCAGAAAVVLTGAIVLMLGLSVAPNLHERLHPTGASLHECAVTLIASSICHHTAAAPLMIAPATAAECPKIPSLIPQWVESQVRGAPAFEHAPPAHSYTPPSFPC